MPVLQAYTQISKDTYYCEVRIPLETPLPPATLFYKDLIRIEVASSEKATAAYIVVNDRMGPAYFNTVRQLLGDAIYEQIIDDSELPVCLKTDRRARQLAATTQQIADITAELSQSFASI